MKLIFLVFALLAVAGDFDPETAKIEAHIDARRPQYAPHRVIEIMRRDSAINATLEVERAAGFYKGVTEKFSSKLKWLRQIRKSGADAYFWRTKKAMMGEIQALDLRAPMYWPVEAIDGPFDKPAKDCVAVQCRYICADGDTLLGVFYLDNDGDITGSALTALDRMNEMLAAQGECMKVLEKIINLE